LRDRLQNIADRIGFPHDGGRQANPEGPLDPRDQLGSPETVDAEIAIEAACQSDFDGLHPWRVKLAHQLGHQREHLTSVRSWPGGGYTRRARRDIHGDPPLAGGPL